MHLVDGIFVGVQCCLVTSLVVPGTMILASVMSKENRYYQLEPVPSDETCYLILYQHGQTVEFRAGMSTSQKGISASVSERKFDTEDCAVDANYTGGRTDNSEGKEVYQYKLFEATTEMEVRFGSRPMSFERCEQSGNDVQSVDDREHNAMQQVTVAAMILWALLKYVGMCFFVVAQSDDEQTVSIITRITTWVSFVKLPEFLLAPITSLDVHTDCPQMFVWVLRNGGIWQVGTWVAGLTLFETCLAVCGFGCHRKLYYGVLCLVTVQNGLYFLVSVVMNIMSFGFSAILVLDFSLIFSWRWPEYQWASALNACRVLAVLLWLFENLVFLAETIYKHVGGKGPTM